MDFLIKSWKQGKVFVVKEEQTGIIAEARTFLEAVIKLQKSLLSRTDTKAKINEQEIKQNSTVYLSQFYS